MKHFFIVFMGIALLFSASLSPAEDWYSYYIQCAATASQEASCYQSIRDYLLTEEGKKQAQEIGFKRRLFRDHNQISSQSIVIYNRIQQMENYLSSSLQKSEDHSVSAYCLEDKQKQVQIIKKHVLKLKDSLLAASEVSSDRGQKDQVESEYQLLLSLNSRANEIYLQARKCLQ